LFADRHIKKEDWKAASEDIQSDRKVSSRLDSNFTHLLCVSDASTKTKNIMTSANVKNKQKTKKTKTKTQLQMCSCFVCWPAKQTEHFLNLHKGPIMMDIFVVTFNLANCNSVTKDFFFLIQYCGYIILYVFLKFTSWKQVAHWNLLIVGLSLGCF
jgi:hypothetical protein